MLAEFLHMVRAVLLAVLACLVAVAIWLVVPFLVEPESIVLSESDDVRRLLETAPASAGTVIAIPSFAPVVRRYERILFPLLGSGGDRAALSASAWLLGRAPVGAWDSGDSWGALVRPGRARSVLIRAAAPLGGLEVEAFGDDLLLNGAASPERRELAGRLVEGLEGEVFLRHLDANGYPPTPRPALTALRLDAGRLRIETRAPAERPVATIPLSGLTFPTGALLAVRFAEPPEGVLAIEKAVPLDLPRLLAEGGMMAIYGIETDGLVPRLRAVFAVPADQERAAEISSRIERLTTRGAVGLLLGMGDGQQRLVAGIPVMRREGFGVTVETAHRGGEMLIAFDGSSLESYLGDQIVPAGEGEVAWAFRASPNRLLPLLDELGRDRALRLFASDFARETRELAATLRQLPPAAELRSRLEASGETLVLRTEAEPEK